ncbi:DUF4176 domain-containing protein [Enterococcus sp. AZ177]|uniref:DUF4176 domain-containing protein n=1 Tax=unclassified Enterococcus TaxID=2608891 RepID=UPI003D2FFAA9
MASYDTKKFFEEVLENDDSLLFEVTNELITTGVLLGTNFPLLKGIYKAYRNEEEQFEHKPMVGAKLTVSFDHDTQRVVLDRQTSQVELTNEQFLQYMGKIDVAFAPIYPVGTTVELDESMLTEELAELFKKEELGAVVTLSGRKIPLMSGFEQYIVDYLGHLWPYGEIPGNDPILISNMMIKRVIAESLTNEYEEAFAFDGLRTTQVTKQQVSTAYMKPEDTIAYFEVLSELSEQE